MTREADIKLIDLLSLKPGALLRPHPVTGEAECVSSDDFARDAGWQQEFSHAVFPGGTPQKIYNFSKLLEIQIEFQILVRHPDDKVVEIHGLETSSWREILSRPGLRADIMVDGRIIAQGEIIDNSERSGILITRIHSGVSFS